MQNLSIFPDVYRKMFTFPEKCDTAHVILVTKIKKLV